MLLRSHSMPNPSQTHGQSKSWPVAATRGPFPGPPALTRGDWLGAAPPHSRTRRPKRIFQNHDFYKKHIAHVSFGEYYYVMRLRRADSYLLLETGFWAMPVESGKKLALLAYVRGSLFLPGHCLIFPALKIFVRKSPLGLLRLQVQVAPRAFSKRLRI